MAKRRLFWQIIIPSLLITLLAMGGVGTYTLRVVRAFYLEQMETDLQARVRLVSSHLAPLVIAGDVAGVAERAEELGRSSATRVTVIDSRGVVLGDSEKDPGQMGFLLDRPEVSDALRGEVGRAVRRNSEARQNMIYLAETIRFGEGERVVVRVAVAETLLQRILRQITLEIVLGALLAAIAAGIFAMIVSERISRPLREMRKATEHFARGNFGVRVSPERSDEVGGLADAMNWMAAQLDEKIQTVQRQNHEREAILASMVEGVVAIDSREHVINMNRAAAEMLGVEVVQARGRSMQEVIRNIELQQFSQRSLNSDKPIEADLILRDDTDRYIQAHGTILKDVDSTAIGALIVLHDVTRLRKLENVRRDFVANVSHELRTPITSIKGFVETLLEDSPDDDATIRHFLGIVAHQADRLSSIIEDLLSLSRIERESERGGINVDMVLVREMLDGATMTCRVKAEEKNIEMRVSCERTLKAFLNRDLLEQAVVNLLDNAIKYSDEDARIDVLAEGMGDTGVQIRVRDYGCGIARQHLSRLFERFYRVDKARSRKQGGTGLGLAIVKHIAQAHGGTVTVTSTLGEGSIFFITVPSRETVVETNTDKLSLNSWA